jgi:hypothetical protein
MIHCCCKFGGFEIFLKNFVAEFSKMPVPAGYQVAHGHGGASCWTKVKMGFYMGAAIGAASGFLFGGFAVYSLVRFCIFLDDKFMQKSSARS